MQQLQRLRKEQPQTVAEDQPEAAVATSCASSAWELQEVHNRKAELDLVVPNRYFRDVVPGMLVEAYDTLGSTDMQIAEEQNAADRLAADHGHKMAAVVQTSVRMDCTDDNFAWIQRRSAREDSEFHWTKRFVEQRKRLEWAVDRWRFLHSNFGSYCWYCWYCLYWYFDLNYCCFVRQPHCRLTPTHSAPDYLENYFVTFNCLDTEENARYQLSYPDT